MNTRGVIVAGGSYGIGRGIAVWFATRGDSVVIAACDPKRGQAAQEEVAAGGRVLFIPTDVRDEGLIRSMIERAMTEWGRIDGGVASSMSRRCKASPTSRTSRYMPLRRRASWGWRA